MVSEIPREELGKEYNRMHHYYHLSWPDQTNTALGNLILGKQTQAGEGEEGENGMMEGGGGGLDGN